MSAHVQPAGRKLQQYKVEVNISELPQLHANWPVEPEWITMEFGEVTPEGLGHIIDIIDDMRPAISLITVADERGEILYDGEIADAPFRLE